MRWHERIAKAMGVKHSDTVAVVRWGKRAKRASRRRLRRLGERDDSMSRRRQARGLFELAIIVLALMGVAMLFV